MLSSICVSVIKPGTSVKAGNPRVTHSVALKDLHFFFEAQAAAKRKVKYQAASTDKEREAIKDTSGYIVFPSTAPEGTSRSNEELAAYPHSGLYPFDLDKNGITLEQVGELKEAAKTHSSVVFVGTSMSDRAWLVYYGPQATSLEEYKRLHKLLSWNMPVPFCKYLDPEQSDYQRPRFFAYDLDLYQNLEAVPLKENGLYPPITVDGDKNVETAMRFLITNQVLAKEPDQTRVNIGAALYHEGHTYEEWKGLCLLAGSTKERNVEEQRWESFAGMGDFNYGVIINIAKDYGFEPVGRDRYSARKGKGPTPDEIAHTEEVLGLADRPHLRVSTLDRYDRDRLVVYAEDSLKRCGVSGSPLNNSGLLFYRKDTVWSTIRPERSEGSIMELLDNVGSLAIAEAEEDSSLEDYVSMVMKPKLVGRDWRSYLTSMKRLQTLHQDERINLIDLSAMDLATSILQFGDKYIDLRLGYKLFPDTDYVKSLNLIDRQWRVPVTRWVPELFPSEFPEDLDGLKDLLEEHQNASYLSLSQRLCASLISSLGYEMFVTTCQLLRDPLYKASIGYFWYEQTNSGKTALFEVLSKAFTSNVVNYIPNNDAVSGLGGSFTGGGGDSTGIHLLTVYDESHQNFLSESHLNIATGPVVNYHRKHFDPLPLKRVGTKLMIASEPPKVEGQKQGLDSRLVLYDGMPVGTLERQDYFSIKESEDAQNYLFTLAVLICKNYKSIDFPPEVQRSTEFWQKNSMSHTVRATLELFIFTGEEDDTVPFSRIRKKLQNAGYNLKTDTLHFIIEKHWKGAYASGGVVYGVREADQGEKLRYVRAKREFKDSSQLAKAERTMDQLEIWLSQAKAKLADTPPEEQKDLQAKIKLWEEQQRRIAELVSKMEEHEHTTS